MEAAPALPPPTKPPAKPTDTTGMSPAELMAYIRKSDLYTKSDKKKKKPKHKKKKKYTRTETPELSDAISTILQAQPFLIQDVARLKRVLAQKFPDIDATTTYSIMKKVATRLAEKIHAPKISRSNSRRHKLRCARSLSGCDVSGVHVSTLVPSH